VFELVDDVLADGSRVRLTPISLVISIATCTPPVLPTMAPFLALADLSTLLHSIIIINTKEILIQILRCKLLLLLLSDLTDVPVQIALIKHLIVLQYC
jgi:hypothetical protein